MAVVRIQSIKMSSLNNAISHRLNPPSHEELVAYDAWFQEKGKELLFLIPLGANPDRWKILSEILKKEGITKFFEAVESLMFSQKIRKNATIQELVIAYDSNESEEISSNPIEEVIYDLKDFVKAFTEEFGFKPFYSFFIHRDKETGRYHVHFLFSLRNPHNGRKVKWNQKAYFKIINRAARISCTCRIQPPRPKKIGKYPLWMFQRLADTLGDRKMATKITSIFRKAEVPSENYYLFLQKLQEAKDSGELEADLQELKNTDEIQLISKIILPYLNLDEGNPIRERIVEYQRELIERKILKQPNNEYSSRSRGR